MSNNPGAPIVVIGAGMSGLASARHLKNAGLRVVLLESNRRVGGRVFTDRAQGFEIDAGAQFITNFYTHTLNLIRELNLEGNLVGIPGVGAVLRNGKLYKVWPDLRVIFTSLISGRSKFSLLRPVLYSLLHRELLDIHALHDASPLDTASIAAYASRYMNEEVLEYVLQPPLSGILSWEPEHTSQAMLFIMLKVAVGIRLMTLKHGLGQLPEAMAEGLEIQFGAVAVRVSPDNSGGYLVQFKKDNEIHGMIARGVVCSIPANLVPGIFPHLADRQRKFFEGIHYSENAICAVGINRRLPGDAYGLLFPRREAVHLANAAVQSAKNPGQLPAGRDLVVLYPNGPAGSYLIHQSDDRIYAVLNQDLHLAGSDYRIGEGDVIRRVYRWPQALPVFDVGHIQRLRDFMRGEVESGRLVYSGDYLGGPFVEGAITSGYQAADRLLTRLN